MLLALVLPLRGALLLVNLQPACLGHVQLHPLSLRTLPAPWQGWGLGLDTVPPVGLAPGGNLLPRRNWSHALVLSALARGVCGPSSGAAPRSTRPLRFAFDLVQTLCAALDLITSPVQLIPWIVYGPLRRPREASRLAGLAQEQATTVDIWIPTDNESEPLIQRCVLASKAIRHRHPGPQLLRTDRRHRRRFCSLPPGGRAHPRVRHGDQGSPGASAPGDFNSGRHNRNLGLEPGMPDDSDDVFHHLQVIRDHFNAVICCGTSYRVRRSVIESVGVKGASPLAPSRITRAAPQGSHGVAHALPR
ncbi:hypothetical protein [Cyanobium sp. Morenito 9A2]|uniref:hypothetical protein n=1 Tax=Cyanobium sp. Morenito 9A2 TaxID=2823718 RepID=UPI0020CDD9E4|nr:hypothetical protein [Cyanobium sp. Morenito 9A2]MCP9848601.1 hypothetical protein [Cyanobium sp. Morenito 9A2]